MRPVAEKKGFGTKQCGKRALRGAMILAAFVALLGADAPRALAESPRSLVRDGNRRLKKGEYDKAIEYYERASIDAPESPVLALDMGNAHFMREEYAAARDYFEKATLRSDDLMLEAMAWYNMGNTAFRQAERQEDSDLEKALGYYEEAVRFYQTALEKDPELADAAFNLEITRLTIKDLLDRINKQREMMEQQQEKMKQIVDSLRSLVQREGRAAAESRGLGAEVDRNSSWQRRIDRASVAQGAIEKDTDVVQGKLQELFPPDQQPLPVQQALSHIDSSIADQSCALEELSRKEPDAAAAGQDDARGQLEKALDVLTEGQRPPEQQQGEQQEQQAGGQEQPPEDRPEQSDQQQQAARQQRDETARDIIDEEKENKKRRQEDAVGGYKKVDKDW